MAAGARYRDASQQLQQHEQDNIGEVTAPSSLEFLPAASSSRSPATGSGMVMDMNVSQGAGNTTFTRPRHTSSSASTAKPAHTSIDHHHQLRTDQSESRRHHSRPGKPSRDHGNLVNHDHNQDHNHDDNDDESRDAYAYADTAASLPSLITTSPPRYMTRQSLGSVAHTRNTYNTRPEHHQNQSLHPQRSLELELSKGSEGSLLDSLGMDSSPELAGLEATHSPPQAHPYHPSSSSSNHPDSYPSHPASPKTPANTRHTGQQSRKRAPPAPLDLSPPRPSWLDGCEAHPAIQSLSASTSTISSPPSQSHPQTQQQQQQQQRQPHASGAHSSPGAVHANTSTGHYAGLGLGLPFSSSNTSTSLASSASEYSLPPSSSSFSSSLHNPTATNASDNASASTSGTHRVLRKRASGQSLAHSPESPVAYSDRRGLVGLGELSTPRWTAAVHERRWGHQPLPVPMPDARDPDEGAELQYLKGQGHEAGDLDGDEESWEGGILGGYISEDKENDHYAAHRKSMPVGFDSYRSFTDVLPPAHLQAQPQPQSGSMSASSSGYSLAAPASSAGSSVSSTDSVAQAGVSGRRHGAGVFYTPTGIGGDAEFDLVSPSLAQTASLSPNPNSDGSSSRRVASDSLASQKVSTAQPSLIPYGGTARSASASVAGPRAGTGASARPAPRAASRESGRSIPRPPSAGTGTGAAAASGSRSGSAMKYKLTQQERDLPSFMRGTQASASRRNSITAGTPGPSAPFRPGSAAAKQSSRPSTATLNEDPPMSARSRPSSPPSVLAGDLPHPTASRGTKTSFSSSHSRHSSVASTAGKRSLPPHINTSRAQELASSSSSHPLPHPPRSSASSHHSPSAIAHSILRSTRGSTFEGVDISAYAAADEGTAEALRKLDGIGSSSSAAASPRLSKGSAKGSTTPSYAAKFDENTPRKSSGSMSLLRQNSKTSRAGSPPSVAASLSRKSSAKSSYTSQAAGAEPAARSGGRESIASPARTASSHSRSLSQQQSLASSVLTERALPPASIAGAPMLVSGSSSSVNNSPLASPKSPSSVSPTVTVNPSNKRVSSHAARPPSSGTEAPFTPSITSSKRSSSASLAFGTSVAGSRDSTSATSLSAYGSPAHGRAPKSRRGSTSSDVSSVHSGHDPLKPHERGTHHAEHGEQSDPGSGKIIPPVPPLPKDWESFRPSTTGESSLPNSARDAYFKEKAQDHYLRSPAAPAQENLSASGNRRVSMEKPLGPRPLRDLSGTFSATPRSAPATPPLSPTISTQDSVDRRAVTSKTPTRTKWSLSHAFGMAKSPSIAHSASNSSFSSLGSTEPAPLEKSTSYNDLVSTERQQRVAAHRSSILGSSSATSDGLAKRKLASVPDIHSLTAASKSNSHLAGRSSQKGGAGSHGLPTFRHRTDSLSSNSTANTAAPSAKPTVIATSPGRSRSSLLSPRRTPSSIPFFNRRPSQQAVTTNASGVVAPLSPASAHSTGKAPSTPSVGSHDEKAGRKSILGINLFSRGSARKSLGSQQQQAPQSPQAATYTSTSTANSIASPRLDELANEFGVRPSNESRRSSMSAKASSFIGRKRGKTLPSSQDSPVKAEAVNLPPMQMNALPASTVSKLETLSVDDVSSRPTSSSGQKRPLPVPPPRTTRPSRLIESPIAKSTLPTITGSPSVAPLNKETADPPSGSPKPSTPTRIPRPAGSRASPSQLASASGHSPTDESQPFSDLPYRRGSLAPGAGMSSSVPQHHAYLSPQSISTGTSSSESHAESPMQVEMQSETAAFSSDSAPSSGVSAPRSRQALANIPLTATSGSKSLPPSALPTSKSSGLRQPSLTSSTSRPEKRRSVLQQEERDSKTARTPLRPSHGSASASDFKTSSTPSTVVASTIAATPRNRTKTSTLLSPSASASKTSSLHEGLPASKSHRSLASKLSIPSRISKSATTGSLTQSQSPIPSDGGGRSTSSSRYGTPIGEDELRADEEMGDFVHRQKSKRSASGLSGEEIDRMLDFPDPIESKMGITPEAALQVYADYLCDYEREELFEHKHIYYAGEGSKKKMASRHHTTNNFGYDDERGDYLVVKQDHIMFRYEIIDTLGKGSFGQVLRCRDHKTGDMVAVKIIRNKKRFHHQALVEIKVLENLRRWDPEEKHNLLKMGDHFTFRGHLCITTELLSINLYELIKANNMRGFSTNLIRRFTVQILAALSVLRHHRVVHCDLKPENLLLRHPAKSGVKVIDFGSSCFENEKVYTYIQSRFYRSPEVILGMNYHMAIDMWSLGCILAELYTGYPIFPGENEASQLACIMEVLGVPEKHIVDRSSRRKLFFDSTGAPRPVVDSKGRRRRPGAKSLSSVLKCDDELFIDFIAKCLAWDPDRRLKPGPALRHPFCARGRTAVPAAIPPRSSSASSKSLLSSTNISTPRRLEKKMSESVYSTPSTYHSSSLPSTAPVQRTRTQSTAAAGGSMGPSFSAYRLHAK